MPIAATPEPSDESIDTWLVQLRAMGAIWEYPGTGPHAKFSAADKHSAFYLNTDVVVSHVNFLRSASEHFAKHHIMSQPTWVASFFSAPVSAALVFATIMASRLDTRLTFLNMANNLLTVPVSRGDKVLVVVDDVHSGSSLKRVISALNDQGAVIIDPIICLANFSGLDQLQDLSIAALLSRSLEAWPFTQCPLCKAGSEPLSAREKWDVLSQHK